MTSSMKNFRTAVLTLSATILIVPHAVLAGGGSFGGGKTGPSGGNGSFGMGKGPGTHVVSHRVSSLNSSATTTINSSSGQVTARTVNNLATSRFSTSASRHPANKQKSSPRLLT